VKKKTLLALYVLFIAKLSAVADIIPDPVVVKGIVPSHAVDIQMVSEVVKVNLSLDSSLVECTFHLHNWGKQTDLEVGFPIMNFYLWDNDYLNAVNKTKFDVVVRGRNIDKVNLYIPDQLQKILKVGTDRYNNLRTYENKNKPWYLWQVHFEKNEDVTIFVRYRLTNGADKISRFFDYLLSTGAGWKGNINDAKVIVKLNEVADVQMMQIKPQKSYIRAGDEIIWHFKNLKPTIKNDIYLEFETSKGAYKAIQANWNLTRPTYIDGKKSRYSLIDSVQLGSFHIKEWPDKRGYDFVVFTKGYIFKKLKIFAKQSDPGFLQRISNMSIMQFESNEIEINGEHVSGDALYEKLNKIDSTNAVTGKVKKLTTGKTKIIIATKKPLPSTEGFFQSAPQL